MLDRKKIGIIGFTTFAIIVTVSYLFMFVFGIKILLVPKAKYDSYQSLSKLTELQTYIDKNYIEKPDDAALMEGAIKGMFEALNDPYSVYFTEKEYKSFNESLTGEFGGIGVIVTKGDDGYVVVVAPIEDTPGARAGLKTNDKIIKVNGVDIKGMSIDDVVTKMKGTPGTKVHISVLRGTEKALREIDLVRELIKLKTVKPKMLPDGIGYIKLTMFDVDTYKDFNIATSTLMNQGMRGLVIDLRQNPGGYMNQAIDIADLLMDKGLVVYTLDAKGKRIDYSSKDGKLEVPFVILVDGGSASASEILSGAIKDRKIAELIGEKTFGKGVVQTVQDLKDGSGFKLTTQKYYTPNGIDINKKGIMPNIIIKPLPIKDGVDPLTVKDVQLDKAVEVLKTKIR